MSSILKLESYCSVGVLRLTDVMEENVMDGNNENRCPYVISRVTEAAGIVYLLSCRTAR